MSSFPNMSFPEQDELLDCGPWCEPLHMVERVVGGLPHGRYFDIDHFMIMAKLLRRGRLDIILYKHYFTRRYLNLDAAGHSYRYHPPRSDAGRGQYRRDGDIATAIRRLDLHLMPYLAGSPFAGETELSATGSEG